MHNTAPAPAPAFHSHFKSFAPTFKLWYLYEFIKEKFGSEIRREDYQVV